MCLKTQTSEHPCQRVGPSPWGQVLHNAYEGHGALRSLHPDKRRHGACLERLPQTAKTAPLAPLSIQNVTSKPVNDKRMQCGVQPIRDDSNLSHALGLGIILYVHAQRRTKVLRTLDAYIVTIRVTCDQAPN